MKPLELLRRTAGKSPRYLARRGFDELRLRVRSRGLRRDLQALSAADVAARCGVPSLSQLWRGQPFNAFRLSAGEREAIRALYAGSYAGEREVLRGRVERILSHEFCDFTGSGGAFARLGLGRVSRIGPEWDHGFRLPRRSTSRSLRGSIKGQVRGC